MDGWCAHIRRAHGAASWGGRLGERKDGREGVGLLGKVPGARLDCKRLPLPGIYPPSGQPAPTPGQYLPNIAGTGGEAAQRGGGGLEADR